MWCGCRHLFVEIDVGVCLQQLTRCPSLHPCGSQRTVDEAYGAVEALLQHCAEEVGGGAEVACGGGCAVLPFHRDGVGRLHLWHRGHRHKVHLALVSAGSDDGLVASLGGTGVEAFERHLHIALAGGEPHLADEHVAEHGFVLAATDGHGLRLVSGGRCLHRGLPFALLVGNGLGLGAPRGGDAYLGVRRCPAPEVDFLLLLQHHAVAKQRRRLELG